MSRPHATTRTKPRNGSTSRQRHLHSRQTTAHSATPLEVPLNEENDIYVVSEDGRYLHLMIASMMGLIAEDDVYDRPERVEHINGDRLDNRRVNLRLRAENTSGANQIELFMHCAECTQELENGVAPDQSPRSYARIELGVTPTGFQIWCIRHDREVAHFRIPREYFGAPTKCAACTKEGIEATHGDELNALR